METGRSSASAGVTDLYAAHALGLVRLAVVMLGDQQAAGSGPSSPLMIAF